MNKTEINGAALRDALHSLVGAEGTKIITELYELINEAEKRGYAAAQVDAETDPYDAGFNDGYDLGYDDGVEDTVDDYEGPAVEDIDMRGVLQLNPTQAEFQEALETAYSSELHD